jgi:hypothetical protein
MRAVRSALPTKQETAPAAYFVAYLDQRSPLPIANDPRFHLELYRAARASVWCHGPAASDPGCSAKAEGR